MFSTNVPLSNYSDKDKLMAWQWMMAVANGLPDKANDLLSQLLCSGVVVQEYDNKGYVALTRIKAIEGVTSDILKQIATR